MNNFKRKKPLTMIFYKKVFTNCAREKKFDKNKRNLVVKFDHNSFKWNPFVWERKNANNTLIFESVREKWPKLKVFFSLDVLKLCEKFFFFGVVVSKPERPSSYMSNVLKCSFFSPLHLIVETDWVCMCARVKQKKKNTEIHWKRPAAPLAKPRFKYSNRLLRWEFFFQPKQKFRSHSFLN